MLLFKILSRHSFRDRQKLWYVIPSNYCRTVPVHELKGEAELALFNLVEGRLSDNHIAAYSSKGKQHSMEFLMVLSV